MFLNPTTTVFGACDLAQSIGKKNNSYYIIKLKSLNPNQYLNLWLIFDIFYYPLYINYTSNSSYISIPSLQEYRQWVLKILDNLIAFLFIISFKYLK